MHSLLTHQANVVTDAVRQVSPDVVLGTPVADLADLLYNTHCVEPIVLHLDRRTSTGAKDLDLSVDSWRGGQVKADGTRIEVLIPYDGDQILFDIQASHFTHNPPRFDLKSNCVVLVFEGRAPLDRNQAKASIDGLLATIEQHIAWQRNDIDPWNDRLKQDLPQQIEARRTKVLQDRDLDAFLDVPIVGRPNPSMSFAVDPPKKPLPMTDSRPSGSTSFVPEPAISDAGFAAILSEIESVTTAVQRLPRSFATVGKVATGRASGRAQ